MYVTLEPCCHHGLTPPCTDSIIKSKISEVIYSVTDIDKRVSNKSFKILNSKKIIVKKGLLKNKIESFYYPYFFNRKKKLPYVTGKIAISKNNIIYTNYQKKNHKYLFRYFFTSFEISKWWFDDYIQNTKQR